MKKLWNKSLTPQVLALLLIAVITGLSLFYFPLQGMSDNGSYEPILKANGLYEFTENRAYYNSFALKYGILQYFNPNQGYPFSLQNILIQVALFLNHCFYSKTVFDLRFLSLLYYLLFLGACWILLYAITRKLSRKSSFFISLLVVLLLGDTSYTVYFNSFYREPLICIFIIYFVAFGILAYQSQRLKYLLLIFFAQASVTLALSTITPMSDTLALCAFIGLWSVFLYIKQPLFRKSLVLFIVGLLSLCFIFSSLMGNPHHEKDIYNSVSLGVLLENEQPAKALRDLGVSPEYEMLRGTQYDQTYTIVKTNAQQIKKNITQKLQQWELLLYYITHPKDLKRLLDRATENIALGNNESIHELKTEKGWLAKAIEFIFHLGTSIKGAFLPKKISFYFLVSLVILTIYVMLAIRGYRLGTSHYIAHLFMEIALTFMLLVTFVIPIIQDGIANIGEQMVVASLVIDLMLIFIISDYLRHDLWIGKEEARRYQLEEET